MYQTLLTSLEDNILTITINRADKLNALNKTVMSELEEAIIKLEKEQRSYIEWKNIALRTF